MSEATATSDGKHVLADPPEAYEFGPFRLDPKKRQFAKEFYVMVYVPAAAAR